MKIRIVETQEEKELFLSYGTGEKSENLITILNALLRSKDASHLQIVQDDAGRYYCTQKVYDFWISVFLDVFSFMDEEAKNA